MICQLFNQPQIILDEKSSEDPTGSTSNKKLQKYSYLGRRKTSIVVTNSLIHTALYTVLSLLNISDPHPVRSLKKFSQYACYTIVV